MTKDNLSFFPSEGTPVPFDCLQGRVYGLSRFRRTRTQIQAAAETKGKNGFGRIFYIAVVPGHGSACITR